MYRTFSDLRILTLALHVEESFERFGKTLRAMLPTVDLRERVSSIFDDGPNHLRLREAHAKLLARALEAAEEADPKALLQALLDAERSARDFYVHYLDRLSDPALVKIFQGIVREETQHAHIVRSALDRVQHAGSPARGA